MPIAFAAVMPHGDALIPGLGDPQNGSEELTSAMRDAARSAVSADLDALVIATPHGVVLDQGHSVGLSATTSGSLGHLSLELACDVELAASILAAASARDLPVCGVVATDDTGPLPMDWGVFVPMWFMIESGIQAPSVVICPSRAHGLESLAVLGEAIADLEVARRIGFIASADQAHCHSEDGPYGFHPAAKVFDDLVSRLTHELDFESLSALDPALIEAAMPDSPWQLAILAGIARKVGLVTTRLVYGRPSYFGMMCATFEVQPA